MAYSGIDGMDPRQSRRSPLPTLLIKFTKKFILLGETLYVAFNILEIGMSRGAFNSENRQILHKNTFLFILSLYAFL